MVIDELVSYWAHYRGTGQWADPPGFRLYNLERKIERMKLAEALALLNWKACHCEHPGRYPMVTYSYTDLGPKLAPDHTRAYVLASELLYQCMTSATEQDELHKALNGAHDRIAHAIAEPLLGDGWAK